LRDINRSRHDNSNLDGMRILYFSPRDCWPLTSGARLRDYHLSRELSRHAQLTYLGFLRNGETQSWRGPMGAEQNVECLLIPLEQGYTPGKLLRGFTGPLPVTVLNYTTARMRAELTRTLADGNFDLVQMEGIHLSGYLPEIARARSRPRLICDWHNIESELLERYIANRSHSLLKRWYGARTAHLTKTRERRLLEQCDGHLVCSERERQALLTRVPGARIRVTANGVDVEAQASGQSERSGVPRKDVVFVGSMDYHANIDAALYFAREIWPEIYQSRPDLRFVIVGSRPVEEVKALGRLEGITVTGTVDSVGPYYQKALVSVVPLRVGSGTRLKVLEAMAAGVPVISTPLGAEGLDVIDGQHLLLAEGPAAFAAAVRKLAEDDGEWRRLVAEGQEAVRTRYDWSAIGSSLFRYYEELVAGEARSLR
jgi:glycosyltransferase involved in cell wall biosynthesis